MESEKRKRGDDGELDGKRAKEGNNNNINGGGSEVMEEEEEVEEFFAILKRIHVAIKYFEKANGGGRSLTTTGNEWKPSFVLEDFEGDNDVNNNEGNREGSEDSGLDLNLEPVSKKKNNKKKRLID
ncbi:hypothetical protein REPUB_Repub04eG0258800 [Reevesia pubescens]